jgi:hypothetical protein
VVFGPPRGLGEDAVELGDHEDLKIDGVVVHRVVGTPRPAGAGLIRGSAIL